MIPILEAGFKILDKVLPDAKAKADAKQKLIETYQAGDLAELKAAQDIIVSEIKQGGRSSTWRPDLMYLLMFVIAFNAIVVPLINVAFGVEVPVLDALNALPDELWSLITVSIGGYIVGRSGEKAVENWRK